MSSAALDQPAVTRPRSREILFWAATAVVLAVFVGSGAANLLRVEHVAQDLARLGYPAYIMTVLGFWKLAGAAVVAAPGLPRLKEWAYAGMIIDLTSAAASRFAIADKPPSIIVPLVFAGIVLASWALRPTSRRLEVRP